MKLSTRISASGFIEILTDEIEVTIFNDSTKEIDDLISNLESVIEDLKSLKQ
jgi:hypothetical protein